MGCTALTTGRTIDCRNSAGGIKRIYIAAFDTTTVTVSDAQQVTQVATSGSTKLYRYDLIRGTGSLTSTVNGNTENGTIFYTPTVNVKLQKLTLADQNELKLLGAQRMIIFVELNELSAVDGVTKILCLGFQNGMYLNTGTAASGAGLGDFVGYDWTFEGMEPEPMFMCADYTTNPFDNFTAASSISPAF